MIWRIGRDNKMLEILRLEVPQEAAGQTKERIQVFRFFCQAMLNRITVGFYRYGQGSKKQKYLTRLNKEIASYNKTGSAEQLFNIANYCYLEWMYPEHPKHHFDNTAESVTRDQQDPS